MLEYKSIKAITLGIEDRTVTGIFCVHGNVDDGSWYSRDRSHPGLFGDFKVDGRERVVFLWQHNSYEPPIAAIDELYEVSAVDLPPIVKTQAPEATGGVAVKRTYLDTARGNEVLAGLKAGAIREMSYAYEPTRWDFEEESGAYTPIRNLYKADLLDVSDVCWGMNPATSADGSKGMPLRIEQQTVHAAVARYIKRLEALYALRVVKEGRRFSSATLQEIEESIATLRDGSKVSEDAIARLEKLIAAPEPDKTGRAETNQLRATWAAQQQRLRELGVFP